MKAEYMNQANVIFHQMKELQSQRGIIAGGAGFGITIQSAYQDDTFIENIRPYVIDELNRRIA